MPTAAFTKSTLLRASSEVYVTLLTIEHPTISGPLRLACDTVDIVSRGNNYIGFPFEFKFTNDDDSPPRTSIRLQNVDRRIGLALEAMDSPATISFEVVMRSSPNDVELGWYESELFNARWTAIDVTADIRSADYGTEPCPPRRCTQDLTPAIWAAN
jgi:hypothetical protein